MRQRGIILSEFFLKREERFLRATITPNESERPVSNLLFARVPFVSPGKKDGSGEAAAHHTVDMPAQHLRLFLFGMANRIHPELAEHEWFFLGQILQPEKVFFEIALVVEI